MTTRHPTPHTLSVADTAALLADGLGGTADHWSLWLKNDRRPGRAHLIPVEPGPGRPRYARHRIDRFIKAELTTRPEIQQRVEDANQDVKLPAILKHAVMLNDEQLRDELADARLDGTPIDMVAYEVLAGDDQHGQPTIWIRSGLRAGMHCAITLPLSREEVIDRTMQS